ncbi:hypothetical protein TGGT1_311815 [Toxoplasma gondii GT1]|uniref:Transmembrane protein n=1 Tax=Toxoplasma gondii (strain ATCC 50853 / GT1) TaxID=507601 RepID=S7USW2_TOXGG|nr:hypothetical protein TGGT1_311815 [Toxoplasma gondii GT1]
MANPSLTSEGRSALVEAVTEFQLFDRVSDEENETESDLSDEGMRWLILTGFCCCIPWGIGMYLGLFTERKKDRGLRLLGKLAAFLWAIAWVVFIALCILAGIIIMKGDTRVLMPVKWDSPYSMRQTTRCGTSTESIKVEHEAMTHALSEKTYGTVAFMGLMPAKTWSDADLLDHVYKLGFDAISISPPGIGDTTNITAQTGRFYTDENFLSQVLESCLDIRLSTTVFVSHSNIVTRQFFFPLLMVSSLKSTRSENPLVIIAVLQWNASEFIKVNPMMNDHEFYRPKTRNYRVPDLLEASEKGLRFRHPSNQTFSPPPNSSATGFPAMPRVLQATQCIAPPTDDTDQNWDSDEPDLLGPYQFFKGKYKLPGWGTKEQELLTRPLDPPPSDKKSLLSLISSGKLSETNEADSTAAAEAERVARIREIPVEYFDDLKIALTEFLEEIRDRVDIGDYHPDRLPVVIREDRKKEYIHAREKTTIILKSNIYCLSSEASNYQSDFSPHGDYRNSERKPKADYGVYAVNEHPLRPARPLSEFGANEAEDDEDELLFLSPRLRGTDARDHVLTKNQPREHLGPPAPAVHPERFSAAQKRKLKIYYARLDRSRSNQATRRQKASAKKLEALRNRK